MAKIRWVGAIDAVSGRSGDLIYKRRGGTFYMSRTPDFSKRKLSAAQKGSLNRFRKAVIHAQGVLADPVARKRYEREAKMKRKPVYNLVIAEYLSR